MTTISTSLSAYFDRSTQDMTTLQSQIGKIQEQISSGQKISQSSDDPLAAYQLRDLQRKDNLLSIYSSNSNSASTNLTLTDSALSSFANYINQAQTLATQAANGTLNASDRTNIGSEIQQIRDNIIALANSKDSSGHALFGGESTGNAYSLDSSGNASYVGTAVAPDTSLGDGQSVTRAITGPEFLNYTVNGTPTDLLAALKTLGDALQGSATNSSQIASDALASLSASLDKVTTAQTVVGSRMAWVDLNSQRSTAATELNASQEANIGGTDITTAVTQLQQLMLSLQASQAAFSKISSISLFDLLH